MNPPSPEEMSDWEREVAGRAAAYEVERRAREEAEQRARDYQRAVAAKQRREFLLDIATLAAAAAVGLGAGIISMRLQTPLPQFLDYGWQIWAGIVVIFCIAFLILAPRFARVPALISCFIVFIGFGILAGANYHREITTELGRWETTDTEKVIQLVGSGADVNSVGERGYTALLRAARWGNTDLVRYLIQHGADVRAKTPEGKTTLMEAVTNPGDTQLLTALASAGVDIKARDNSGRTVLHYASEAVDDCWKASPEAANQQMLAAIRYLVKAGSDPNVSDNSGKTALMLAAGKCNPAMVKTLLEANANPNAADAEGNTALLMASRKSDYFSETMVRDCAALLLASGADAEHVDSAGNSALHFIARSGKPAALKLLLKSRRQLERRDSQGLTPLMTAAAGCNLRGAEFLISSGANIVAQTRSGETAIDLAAREECVELTRLLTQRAGLPPIVASQKLAALTKNKVVVFVIDAGYFTSRYQTGLRGRLARAFGHGKIVEAFVKNYFAGKVEYFDATAGLDQFDGAMLADAFRRIYEYASTFTNTRIVVNMSWGTTYYSRELEAVIRLMLDKGMILVAAAGNEGTSKCVYPAAYPGVIGVGAAERTQYGYRLSKYSNRSCVVAVAPVEADDMLQVFKRELLYDGTISEDDAEIQALTTVGTSFAAPQVAGVIAAELLSNPTLSSDRALADVKARWPY